MSVQLNTDAAKKSFIFVYGTRIVEGVKKKNAMRQRNIKM